MRQSKCGEGVYHFLFTTTHRQMRPSLSTNSFAPIIVSSSFLGIRQTKTVFVSVPGQGFSAEASWSITLRSTLPHVHRDVRLVVGICCAGTFCADAYANSSYCRSSISVVTLTKITAAIGKSTAREWLVSTMSMSGVCYRSCVGMAYQGVICITACVSYGAKQRVPAIKTNWDTTRAKSYPCTKTKQRSWVCA